MFLEMVACSWAPAVLILRSARPRPPLREVCRQPGTVACPAVVLASIDRFVDDAHVFIVNEFQGYFPVLLVHMADARAFGGAVAPAWILPAAAGRWESATDRVDRLGLAVGISWMALYAARVARPDAIRFC